MLGGILLLALAWSYRLEMYRLLAEGSGPGGAFSSVDHRVTVPATLVLVARDALRRADRAVGRLERSDAPRVLRRERGAAALARRAHGRAARGATLRRIPTRRIARSVRTRRRDSAYTRRAYGVDRMRAESLGTGFADRGGSRPARRRLGRRDARPVRRARATRATSSAPAPAGRPARTGSSAFLVERGEDGAASDGRAFWGIARYDAAGARTSAGSPSRVLAPSGFGDETVARRAGRVRFGTGLLRRSPTRCSESPAWRWSARGRGSRTRGRCRTSASSSAICRRRDRRSCVIATCASASRALAPFFVQGSEILPVVADDSLYWALELYVASDDYPLAERFHVLDAAARLLPARGDGARACGERTRAPRARSDARAGHRRAGRTDFPSLFVRSHGALPRAAGALPPVHRRCVGAGARLRVGGISWRQPRGAPHRSARRGGLRRVARADPRRAAERSASRRRGRCSTRRIACAASWSSVGGAARETSWIPLAPDGQRWGGTVDRLRAPTPRRARAGRACAGARRSPRLDGRCTSRPRFACAPARARRSAASRSWPATACASGPTLAAALGLVSATTATSPPTQVDLRTRAESLYRDMRDALRRGDWTAFGRAFEALGGALRVAPR